MSDVFTKVTGAAATAAGLLITGQEVWALAVGGVAEGTGESAVHTSWLFLTLLGALGIHAVQRHRAGAFGDVAALVAVVGLVGMVAAAQVEVTLLPALPAGSPLREDPPAAFLALMLGSFAFYVAGLVLLGVAVCRAGVLPWRAGALLAASVPLGLATGFLPGGHLVPMGIALTWLGLATAQATPAVSGSARLATAEQPTA